jgi:hypothetical protein
MIKIDIEGIISQLSIDEKASLLSGTSPLPIHLSV